MEKYIFILGKNPELSLAEIQAVFPDLKLLQKTTEFAVFEGSGMACQEAQNRLGGTIKIGKVIYDSLDKEAVVGQILGPEGTSGAISGRKNFGFSWYGVKQDRRIGMEIKKELKAQGISCRLVESKETQLSSVIVSKEKCMDFLVLPGMLGVTCAVQDFRDYSDRDFGRPKSDALSGMLPPKVAKMMINLSQAPKEEIILDPFCGSGTILSEAIALGYRNLIGCDISNKAVDDSAKNVEWLVEKLGIKKIDCQIFASDVQKLSQKVEPKSIGAIVTEPYLGKPIKGFEKEAEIRKIIAELEYLYVSAFKEFKKVLKKGARVVIVIPEWHLGEKKFVMKIEKSVEALGFKRLDEGKLIYKRSDQKVWRNICIYEI